MKTIDFSYFIERYNAGEMSEPERKWFEKEIKGNKRLSDEVKLRRDTDLFLERQDVISLRNKLSKIEEERSKSVRNRKKLRIPVKLKLAAIITSLVLIGSIVIFPDRNYSNDEIITKFYKAYEPLAETRSGHYSQNENFNLALEYFNTYDYRNAAIYFGKVLETDPKYMESTFLTGVSNFEDKKYPEAKQSFNEVVNDSDNLFIETSKWYLALCYIKTNERDKALHQFEIIKAEGGIYMNDAKKIIRKLRK